MKTMTVRQIRQSWPEAESALALEGEIIVTRDSKPVAKIVPVGTSFKKRPRFDPLVHERWMNRFWKKKAALPSTDAELARDRADRS